MRAVVVTGARGGVGEATANEVLSLGDRVYGTGSSYDETSRIAATLPDPAAGQGGGTTKRDCLSCLRGGIVHHRVDT